MIILPSLKAGGMERVGVLLANHWATFQNIEVHLIELVGWPRFYKADDNVMHHKPLSGKSARFMQQAFQSIWRLRKKISKIKPDALLAFGDRYNSLSVLSSLGLSASVYVSDRQNPFLSNGRLIDGLNRIFYKRANGIIAQTEKAKSIQQVKYRHNNIKVIGNPFAPPVAIKTERKHLILNVGRFGDQKNQQLLVSFFDEIQTGGWQLQFFGDGYKKSLTVEAINKSHKKDRIEIKGFDSQIIEQYQKASIFAFTSTSEGFPNALGEAMAHGCACIAFDCVAGPSDLIDGGVNGFLIPVGDHAQYKEKLQRLINEPDLRERFGKAAHEKMKQFSIDKIAKQYLDFMLGEKE